MQCVNQNTPEQQRQSKVANTREGLGVFTAVYSSSTVTGNIPCFSPPFDSAQVLNSVLVHSLNARPHSRFFKFIVKYPSFYICVWEVWLVIRGLARQYLINKFCPGTSSFCQPFYDDTPLYHTNRTVVISCPTQVQLQLQLTCSFGGNVLVYRINHCTRF